MNTTALAPAATAPDYSQCPAAQHAMNTGEIAIQSRPKNKNRILYHLMRDEIISLGDQARTVCGRYTFARHIGNEPISSDTKVCTVCLGTHNASWTGRFSAALALANS